LSLLDFHDRAYSGSLFYIQIVLEKEIRSSWLGIRVQHCKKDRNGTALTSRMKEMASLGVIGSNENLRDACKKKPVFPRTIMRSRNFTMAGKSKRMASNLGQVLRNHQELTGKIGKRGHSRQHSWLRNIRNWS